MSYWPALALGFFGSMHCALMCSPLMLSVKWSGKTGLAALGNKVVYQMGRIMAYVAIGLLFYTIGSQLNLAAFQKTVSVVIGVLLILLATTPLLKSGPFNLWALAIYRKTSQLLSPLTQRTGWLSKFLLGLLNGLLPCGLVYIAALTSITETTPIHVMKYMVAFGLGTSPILITVLYGAGLLKSSRKLSQWHLRPIAFVLIGTIFILRGMELGIPYISPIMNVAAGTPLICD